MVVVKVATARPELFANRTSVKSDCKSAVVEFPKAVPGSASVNRDCGTMVVVIGVVSCAIVVVVVEDAIETDVGAGVVVYAPKPAFSMGWS